MTDDRDPSLLRLDHFLPYRLSVASNAVSGRIARTYRKRHNLKVTEWRLIAILAETPRLTPQMLTRKTRMDKINVSRAAKALIERGLVSASPNGEDGRSHFLSLTEAGRALYGAVAPEALAMEQLLLSTFTEEERAQFAALLRRIEAAAED
ncbi:MarR family winged helix-turn-helix transcriptional regulator [Sphingomonas sp. C3-2]|uniref:MarR family winged helix-turn-helix transcriptional regulator n=1 Tax=Sphingomonas sp. C3-2 TaxID=3062169 RepID=UPI00294B3931|nr:MarR family transcriptional regulator [Sphingomonas sp. C3-2]WOK36363.1 MarR family transcriptional regulator [Sphingomonas sp. C3-2]